jgi:hypothetical protein
MDAASFRAPDDTLSAMDDTGEGSDVVSAVSSAHNNAIVVSPALMAPGHRRASASSTGPAVGSFGGIIGSATSKKARKRKSAAAAAATMRSAATAVSAAATMLLKKNGGHAPAHRDDEDDPLGEALTTILNRHPEWNFRMRRSSPISGKNGRSSVERRSSEQTSLEWDRIELVFQLPILSRHNWRVIEAMVWRWIRDKPWHGKLIRPRTWTSSLSSARSVIKSQVCSSLPALRFFLLCLAIGLLQTVALAHVAIEGAVSSLARNLLVGIVASLLIETNDLPPSLHRGLQRVIRALEWIDARILWGRRWSGREWTRDRNNLSTGEIIAGDEDPHLPNPSSARRRWSFAMSSPPPPSRDTSMARSLWELPPPETKNGRRLCLSLHHLQASHVDEWSPETALHRRALNYCYVMIREDHLQTQAERQNRQQRHHVRTPWDYRNRDSEYAGQDGGNETDEDELHVRRSYSDGGRERITRGNRSQVAADQLSESDSNERQPRGQKRNPGLNLTKRLASAATDEPRGETVQVRATRDGAAAERGGGDDDDDDGTTELTRAWLRRNQSGSPFEYLSEPESSVASDCGLEDLPWIDVTAQIGMRLLNSAHVHRAITDPNLKNKLLTGSEASSAQRQHHHHHPGHARQQPHQPPPGHLVTLEACSDGASQSTRSPLSHHSGPPLKVMKPVHAMWTSPSAAAAAVELASPTLSHRSDGVAWMNETTNSKLQWHASAPSQCEYESSVKYRAQQDSLTSLPEGKLPGQTAPRQLRRLASNDLASTSDSIEVQLHPPTLPYPATIVPSSCDAPRHKQGLRTSSPADTMISTQTVTVSTTCHPHQRQPLLPGVKVAVPIHPIQPRVSFATPSTKPSFGSYLAGAAGACFQMGTVVRSQRIYVDGCGSSCHDHGSAPLPNCLSVTVKLDKSYLRNAEFAELTFRVMDEWMGSRYMPRHSKVPIGSCVATTFGLGVVVGWRVHDDCHVVRSLWQRRGTGSAHAYLQPTAIRSVVEAAVGFDVSTKYGPGITLAYVDGGPAFESGRFLVAMKDDSRHQGRVIEMYRRDVYSCLGAQFIPVIEHIREAALYKIQMDNYEAALREQNYDDSLEKDDEWLWKTWSACLDILWSSFLRAVDEDSAFDEGVNELMTSIIDFLERLDATEPDNSALHKLAVGDFEVECYMSGDDPTVKPKEKEAPGLWVINDIFGGIFRPHQEKEPDPVAMSPAPSDQETRRSSHYDRVFAVLRTIMKTISYAKAESVEHPHFRLALAISHDFLLFIRTIVKVQQKNSSSHSLAVWKHAFQEISLTFGPLKDRLEKIGRGVAQRMEKHGRRAKTRVLRFVDTILGDEKLLFAMEQGEWDQCVSRLEIALVKSKIIQEQSLFYYRKTGQFIYEHIKASVSHEGGAASRNNEKLALLGQALRSIASPLRSILKILLRPDVLDLFERILVRVYCREEQASQILTIHASNFHSFRHLRMLKDFSVAGKIWIPLLDAADEEFAWVVAQLPENSKEFMCPLSNLFSLCVAQFHKINAGDLSKDWLDFLLEDDAVRIIYDIDMKLILALEQFSRDIREMMEVLPYYPR